MRKVRIRRLPRKASGGETNGLNKFTGDSGVNQFAASGLEVNKSISAVDRSEANIEAEGGEFAVVPGAAGIPESYKINGPRHNAGGVPLNLAPDSFIFSDFNKLKIKDRDILKEFGMNVPKKGRVKGYTPADIAKKFDINKFKKILLDPDSDMTERETAEIMIINYNLKLGKLALVQESMKGFPNGVPAIAIPYLQSIGQDPAQFEGEGQPEMAQNNEMIPAATYGGENKKMAKRFPGLDIAEEGKEVLQKYGNREGLNEQDIIDAKSSWRDADLDFLYRMMQPKKTNKFVEGQPNIPNSSYSLPGDFTKTASKNFFTPGLFNSPGSDYATSFEDATPEFKQAISELIVESVAKNKLNKKQRGGQYEGAFWNSIMQGGGPVSPEQMQELSNIINPNIGALSNNAGEQGKLGLPEGTYYHTKSDFTASKRSAGPPEVVTEGAHIMKNGQPEEKEEWIDKTLQDAKSKGEDPNKVIAANLVDMTPEEIDQANRYIKSFNIAGVHIKSIKKEMAKEETKANRNSYRMLIVDGNTGQVINANPSETEIKVYRNLSEQTVGKNVKTTGKPVYNLPEGAIIHDDGDNYNESKAKAGEYLRRKDGTIYKIGKGDPVIKSHTQSGADNYTPRYGSIEADVEKAKEIMKANSSTFTYNKKTDKWQVAANSKDLPLTDQEFLTRLFSVNNEEGKGLGAPGLNVGIQSSKNAQGGFYGFVGPELIEYQNWKANNPDGTADAFEALDPEEKLANRKNYFALLQIDTEDMDLSNPDSIYTKDFVETKLLPATENLYPVGTNRGQLKNTKFGIEHADAYNISAPTTYEAVQAEKAKEEGSKVDPIADPVYKESTLDAPWWAQDIGNMLMTVGERASIKKYMPHSYPVDLATPDVLYYDPSRALAANAEQSNIAAQSLNAFGNSQQAAAQMSGIQGQGFTQAANILADYEGKNVGIANQYLDKVHKTYNEENMANALRMQKLFDQTTMANQQYDNSKRAANRNIFEAWRQGLTNATKTQTLNTLYPQFDVHPWDGGTTGFTEGRDFPGEPNSRLQDYTGDAILGDWEEYQKDQNAKGLDANYTAFRDIKGLGRNAHGRKKNRSDFMSQYSRQQRNKRGF